MILRSNLGIAIGPTIDVPENIMLKILEKKITDKKTSTTIHNVKSKTGASFSVSVEYPGKKGHKIFFSVTLNAKSKVKEVTVFEFNVKTKKKTIQPNIIFSTDKKMKITHKPTNKGVKNDSRNASNTRKPRK